MLKLSMINVSKHEHVYLKDIGKVILRMLSTLRLLSILVSRVQYIVVRKVLQEMATIITFGTNWRL